MSVHRSVYCIVKFVFFFLLGLCCLFISLQRDFHLQCFDAVGSVTGMASGLRKAGCWLVGRDDLAGALHVL